MMDHTLIFEDVNANKIPALHEYCQKINDAFWENELINELYLDENFKIIRVTTRQNKDSDKYRVTIKIWKKFSYFENINEMDYQRIIRPPFKIITGIYELLDDFPNSYEVEIEKTPLQQNAEAARKYLDEIFKKS